MKKRMISIIIALILTVASVVCMALVSSAEETASTALTAASEGEVIDVWLVAGQSNAIGSANADNYPTDEAYADYKTLLTNGSQNVWHIRNTYTEFVPAGFGQGSGSQCGPELGITTALDSSTNKNVIIKVAYGNTCLYDNTTSTQSIDYGTWTPPSYIDKYGISTVGNRTGDLYLTFISKVAYSLAELETLGYTPNLKGIWYMQGEADTLVSSTTTERYEELLLTLISDMRADLTEISGTDCSELPFVYGRILSNHANLGKDVPKKLTEVQTAQDNIAANTSLTNVFMINTTTDLIDPVTGEHRLPVQQDGWHYDSLSQQMIGERFVAVVNQEERELTKYGYIPADYADAEAYPFAVFKKIDGGYAFDSAYGNSSDSAWATAMTRAIALTKSDGTAVTEEAVVLLRCDLDTTSFLMHTSDIGATVTVDLNGFSFASRTSLCNTKTDDCLANGAAEAKDGVINVKNGTLLMGNFGILYSAKNGTYTKEKTLTFNFEDLNIGFATNAKATCKTLLGIAYDSHAGDVVAKYEMNFVNCVIDSVTNCPTDSSYRIADLDASGESAENGYNNAVSITFLECTIKANDISHLDIPMSAEGDSVKFLKGEDGSYGRLQLPSGTYTDTFAGVDGDYEVELAPVYKDGEYYLVESADAKTEYGTIPAAYSNSYAYPYAIFKKIDGNYVFDSVQSNVKTAFTRATELTHVTSGVTDDVIILVRRSIAKDGTYPSNISDAAGTITLDLNGCTIRPTTALLRTDLDDDGVVDGEQKKLTVNIKNGSMELCQFGILFTTIGTTYTVPKTIDLNLEGVKLGFYETTVDNTQENYKFRDLLVSDRSNSSTTKAYINVRATDCNFDLESNAQSNAVLGTLRCSSDKDMNDYSVEIIGGTIITDDIAKVNCFVNGTGDSLIFKKNTDGKYPRILMNQNIKEPESTESRIGENENALSFVETREKFGIYKVYDMCEDVMTKYGRIPYVASVNNFALFYKDSDKNYNFVSGYATYTTAMTAAIGLTTAAVSEPVSEAVILLCCDWSGTSFPYNLSDIATTVTVDLNGYTLGALESLGNTTTGDVTDPDGNIVKTTGTINYKNGKLLMKAHPGLYIAKGTTYTEGYQKTLNVNFDNIYFGLAEGATSIALLGRIASNLTTETAFFNLKYTNCTIDMATNYSTGSSFYVGNWAPTSGTDSTAVTVDFIDCEFLGLTEADFVHRATDGQDTVRYSKTEGNHYATLTLPKDAAAPSGEYNLDGGITGVFVKAYETADSVIYRLVPKEIAELGYSPKMSITLSNELVMNAYVPANCTEEFTFNGITYNADNNFGGNVVAIDGKDYYLVTVALGSSEAAKEMKLVANVTVGEKTASTTFTFSIPKYAAKVLVSDEAAEMEKTLARDVLAYIKEAYKYFGTDHNSAAEITRVTALIESIIGDYTAAPVSSGTTVNVAGVTYVTLNLDAKPTIRFYVTVTAIEFSANGKKLNTVTGTDTKGTYVELDVYAYALCETVNYGDGGSYHISSFVNGSASTEYEMLVKAFVKYVESAADYRKAVIGSNN